MNPDLKIGPLSGRALSPLSAAMRKPGASAAKGLAALPAAHNDSRPDRAPETCIEALQVTVPGFALNPEPFALRPEP
jgi:hypothetical protein